MLRIVTGWWGPDAWQKYGDPFCSGIRHWPESWDLVAYMLEPRRLPRGHWCDLRLVPGLEDFWKRNGGDPVKRGRCPNAGWWPKEYERGYSYRFDAMKWAPQGMIPREAARDMDSGILVWLDADTVPRRAIPEGLIEDLIGDAPVAYLGRDGKHSEIGFVAYRLPEARPILETFADFYRTDAVFRLGEWHSAFVFDRAREATGLHGRNLTPGGRGHVFRQSPLSPYLEHRKGKRKLKFAAS